jgi:hypothetical protein
MPGFTTIEKSTRMNAKLFLLFAMFSVSMPASARQKLSLSLSPVGVDACGFSAIAEPSPALSHLKRVKTKGKVQFRQGNRIVESYPEEIHLNVRYGNPDGLPISTIPSGKCVNLDPVNVKFSASWRNQSGSVVAPGSLQSWEILRPAPMCETGCAGYSSYELRLDSSNIALTDELVITVYANDGKVIPR